MDGNALSPLFMAPTAAVPSLPSLGLSEQEQGVANWLGMRLFEQRPYLELRGLYYDGMQKMQDLGISIPPSLVGLRTVVGWPQIGIDALDNRCIIEGFRFPGATEVDDDLQGIWQANKMDGDSRLAHLDAFVFGRAYNIVGPGDDSTGGQPLITSESPLNMIATYDARMRRVSSALQIYLDTDFTSDMYGQEVAALYLPDKTIFMARQSTAGNPAGVAWNIVERDDHGLGRVPVVRLANRQRLSRRDGLSEINAAWMNTTDSACRTMLGMEVGREFFQAPRRYALGVTEEAFQNADGSAKTAWDTYLHKVWMLERDEDGNLPTIGEFKAGDPTGHTKLMDEYAQIMAGNMGVPPHFLGIYTQGNPASADAIRSGYEELTSRALKKQVAFSDDWEETMLLALLVRDGSLPDNAFLLETDWRDPAPQTVAGTSDAITKQIASGAIPAASDVTLKRLGYSAVERARLSQDRAVDQGASMLQEIAHSLEAKALRTEKLVNADAAAAAAPVLADGTPTPNVMPKKVPVSAPANH
ncbi:MAG: phage portal protein [Propionibacterium sp.]|nr:phage portal protein [Propionibacterium sp.]